MKKPLPDAEQVHEPYSSNPFRLEDGWYWYDEAGDIDGPFPTEEIAAACCADYCKHVLEGVPENAQKFTVWVVQVNGRGTHHVSSHEAVTPAEAGLMALEETRADWEYPEDKLHVLGICKGVVEIVEWDESVFGDG